MGTECKPQTVEIRTDPSLQLFKRRDRSDTSAIEGTGGKGV